MAITVTHSKVSTIPDGDDTSLIRPSDWNDTHVLTGTVPVANGGTGASTLTGYVKGNGTSTMTASSTIPSTDITGLGTMSTQNANNVTITGGSISGATVLGYIPTSAEGVANGVATLDSGGTVPLSQIPASIIGGLNYQGSWNASTNSPTLTSSVGTKGYYYVVSVAGTTNLNGITDWQVGDLAVFNGSAWQKIDNTDAVTSVNGYTGAVVLTYSDVGAANAPVNTNITSMTGITGGISTADYVTFDTTYATTLTAGQLGWDGNNTLGLGMAGGNVVQRIGEDVYIYVKASSAITKGQLTMFTGAVGASSVVTAAPSTGVTNGQYIIGLAAESIALNGFGLIQILGSLKGFDTSAFADGDILYYDSAVTGGLTKTYPTSGPIVTVCAVTNAGSGGSGSVQVRVSVTQRITASTGISVSQNGTGTTITNTAPDQTVVLSNGTGISVTGTYPNFTITNTSPSSGGTVTSVSGTAPVSVATGTTTPVISLASGYGDTQNPYASKTANYVLAAPNGSAGAPTFRALVSADIPALSYVSSVSGTTGRITSTGGLTPVIDLASGVATPGTTGSSSLIPVITIDTYGRVTSITTASNPQGTVTSVSGTGTVSGIALSGTVTSSGSLTLGGTLDLSSPPAIGGTTPAAITGTTITATKFVGVSGGTF